MKKIFTLALTALALGWTSNVFAQEEEDMTSYIVNAGFDEDLTWNADGSKKQAEPTSTKDLGTRSISFIAEDGSLYATTKSSSTQNRSDGRKADATNGYTGQIKGWEWVDKAREDTKNCEWVYFGTVAYGLGSTAIPIADDGKDYQVAPPVPTDFDGGTGALHLRAGWSNSFSYQQVVKLPCAVYRLEYWTINVNPNTTAQATDLSEVICRKEHFSEEGGTALTATTWTKHEFEFTPTQEFTIKFGFKADNAVSSATPWVYIDGIKLYKIGEADRAEILQADLYDLGIALQEFLGEEPFSNYSGLITEIEDMAQKADDASNLPDDKLDEMEAIYNEVDAYRQKLEALKTTLEEFGTAIDDAETFYTDESAKDNPYPGIDQLSTDIEAIKTKADEAGSDDFTQLQEDIQTAINNYYMSQEATKDNPADYTFLIDNPTFTAQGKWYIGPAGGDQSIKTNNLLDNDTNTIPTVWNSWRNNFTSSTEYLSINQDLTGLPNGYYTITADLTTQVGCITDQHVFANSTIQSGQSEVYSETPTWDKDQTAAPFTTTWQTLTSVPVIVTDGKLTIGALGHGAADTPADNGFTYDDHRRGWFCVTNFKLNYLGEATAEEIAEATAKKYEDAKALVDALHFAKDKADLTDSIADAKAENDLDKVNRTIAIAEASEAEYNGIMTGSYKTLQDNIASDEEGGYSADAKALAQVPVQYMTDYLGSAAATYTETGAITTVLRAYRDNLIPALQKAETKQSELTSEDGKALIADAITYVKNKLATYASRYIENEVLMYLRRTSRLKYEVSLDEPLKTDWDGNELLLSDVLGTEGDLVSRGVEEDAERQVLSNALSHLPQRERKIMNMRFGLEGNREMTQKEVADELGISQSYISRLEKRILSRLQTEMARSS